MKIILSRKGFDSTTGGIPSPIFPNGDMISLPIPDNDDIDKYSELQYKYNNHTYNYQQILEDLYGCKNTKICKNMLKKLKDEKNPLTCHLDPDLDSTRRKVVPNGWEPLFGQIDQAGRYLDTNIINLKNEDYLFLFFGWFHNVVMKKDKFMYKNGKYEDKHVIWGYMLIEKKIIDEEEQKKKRWHPHSKEARTKNRSNIIFTAKAKKAGIFNKIEPELVLTDDYKSRSVWKYKDVYNPENVMRLKDKNKRTNSAPDKDKNIFYKGQWQELFLTNSNLCEKWAKEILPKGVLDN